MGPARAQVTLGIDLDSEPIAGSLRHADGHSTTFSGWIELVSLLQTAATTQTPRADPRAAPAAEARPEEIV